MQVSVIIAAHNGEKYLAHAIESVFNQNYPDYEILVIDNGSTDGTEQVANAFPNIRYEKLPIGNVAEARNLGAELGKGKYLAFLDQDDLWMPNKLSLQVAYLESNPTFAAVIGLQELFLEPGCEKPHWLKREFLESPQQGYLPSALMVRRSAFQEKFAPELTLTSDADWFFKMFDAGLSIALLPDVVIQRRIHSDNNSNQCSLLHKELLFILKQSIQRKRERICSLT